MVGRDIGTVVLPDAELKIYLDADVETRARRRYLEVAEREREVRPEGGSDPDYQAMLEAMVRRDRIDSNREVAPLRPASDAVIVDTTDMSIEQVLDHVVALACTVQHTKDQDTGQP
jgi:cytidylate kinase